MTQYSQGGVVYLIFREMGEGYGGEEPGIDIIGIKDNFDDAIEKALPLSAIVTILPKVADFR